MWRKSTVVRTLPNKMSCGTDGISYKLVKEAGHGVVGPLTSLFNHSLRLRRISEEWKNAVGTPIFGGGPKDRHHPTTYRPISLTSCAARIMEKLLNAQILEYLQSTSLRYKHQSGFLPRHSTVTQLCYLMHKWLMAIDQGNHVQATFLDLSKAYDRVSPPGLLFKLSSMGFSPFALECRSSWLSSKSGNPQGTVLGPVPFLFTLMIYQPFLQLKVPFLPTT